MSTNRKVVLTQVIELQLHGELSRLLGISLDRVWVECPADLAVEDITADDILNSDTIWQVEAP